MLDVVIMYLIDRGRANFFLEGTAPSMSKVRGRLYKLWGTKKIVWPPSAMSADELRSRDGEEGVGYKSNFSIFRPL